MRHHRPLLLPILVSACTLSGIVPFVAVASPGSKVTMAMPNKIAPAPFTGVYVTANVNEAEVYVDGKRLGELRQKLEVPPGKHTIVVAASGYKESSGDYSVAVGQLLAISFVLKKAPSPTGTPGLTDEVFGSGQAAQSTPKKTRSGFREQNWQAAQNLEQTAHEVQVASTSDAVLPPQIFSSQVVVERRSPIVALLPFGAGQFQNGDTMKGSLFLLAQGIGLGAGLYYRQRDSDFTRDEERRKSNDNPARSQTLSDNYGTREAKTYHDKLRTNQMVSFGLAGGAWLLSVLDALTNIDESRTSQARLHNKAKSTEKKESTASSPATEESLPLPPTRSSSIGIMPLGGNGLAVGVSLVFP